MRSSRRDSPARGATTVPYGCCYSSTVAWPNAAASGRRDDLFDETVAQLRLFWPRSGGAKPAPLPHRLGGKRGRNWRLRRRQRSQLTAARKPRGRRRWQRRRRRRLVAPAPVRRHGAQHRPMGHRHSTPREAALRFSEQHALVAGRVEQSSGTTPAAADQRRHALLHAPTARNIDGEQRRPRPFAACSQHRDGNVGAHAEGPEHVENGLVRRGDAVADVGKVAHRRQPSLRPPALGRRRSGARAERRTGREKSKRRRDHRGARERPCSTAAARTTHGATHARRARRALAPRRDASTPLACSARSGDRRDDARQGRRPATAKTKRMTAARHVPAEVRRREPPKRGVFAGARA